jgi:uncharacterized protein (TIGR00369 family)
MPAMNADELAEFLVRAFPQAHADQYRIEVVREGVVRTHYTATDRDLRPGETVSGPTLMALADMTMYLAVLSEIGPVALAVTTNLNIHFLRKPSAGKLTTTATLLKLGKRLAVGEVLVESDGVAGPVAHATVTYSIPPRP